ncbi:ankyrin repeat domain-containing protein [Roseimaritima sediminicola]|uniref:ankyrin repeat domain-containing protein n=1 Tax=Roseimaritima sediminicola TaxID=2662066 RepID=UPI001386BFFA|nr:ankyrin repeat domain-containing protein [Roseimaritima sediminicola]
MPSIAAAQSQPAPSRPATTAETATAVKPDAAGRTPLHHAAIQGDLEEVKSLLASGADVDAATRYGVTPLRIACTAGDAAMVRVLLAAEADPQRLLPGEETLLMLASRVGNREVVEALLHHGADVNAVQRRGQTALMWAAAAGHEAVVDLLLEHGADVDATLESGFTAFHFAAREGRLAVVRRLLNAGVDVSAVMKPKRTGGRSPRARMSALMLAVESGHFEVALALVDAGADPNDQRSGYAPLHALSWVRRPSRGDNPAGDPPPRGSGNVDSLAFVQELVTRGADVNLQLQRGGAGKARLNPRGAPPLLFASFTADLPLMRQLMQCGADVSLANSDGCTPMLAAAGVGVFVADEYPGTETEVLAAVEQLFDWGADLHVVDDNGETVMHGAAYRSFPRVVELFADLGARPEVWNRKNALGSTPLEVAQGKRPGSFKPNRPTQQALIKAAQQKT